MAKLWLVARHEYLVAARRRTFLLGTFGLPLAIAALMALSVLVAVGTRDRRPLGYVDSGGLLSAVGGETGTSGLRAYGDEAAAKAALLAGEIQAYYVIPKDYRSSGRVILRYGAQRPSPEAVGAFQSALRHALLAGQPAEVRAMITRGVDLVLRTADGRRELSTENILSLLLPFVAGAAFTVATLTSANYMIQAVATEKENRMVEVVGSSTTPTQLIGGKALGLMAVAMTQLGLWALVGVVGLLVMRARAPSLTGLHIPGHFLLVILLFFLPSYALVAGLMTAIGAAVTEVHQGQQIAGTLNLIFVVPFFFLLLPLADPNAPLLVAFTLFPTTAFVTVAMRWAFTDLPLWQLVLSWCLLVTAALLCVWAAGRIFRAGMLHYGQSLGFRSLASVLRGSPGPVTLRGLLPPGVNRGGA